MSTKFTSSNVFTVSSPFKNNGKDYRKIVCDKEDLIIRELSWQKRGMSFTRSGYGNKIPTRYVINYNDREYRVYCRIFSNIGTCYIVSKGEEIVIDAS